VAAPAHVPTSLSQQPRRGLPLPPALSWRTGRPSDLGPAQPTGHLLGNPGPDQGYALRLARRFEDRLVPGGHEVADVVAGCLGVALKRASIFGRAPVIHDLTIAFTVWGFLDEAPQALVDLRTPLFQAASIHYEHQREIADHVPVETLRLPHADVQQRYPQQWKALLGLD
jgi:hypothetical protein